MKQSHWLLCAGMNYDWSRKITQLWNLTRKSLFVDENLQRKQNWTAKSTNLKRNARKVRSIFVTIAALWAEKLGCCLEWYCRSWKITPGKLVVPVNTEAEAIRFKFWLKGALVKVQICVLFCCCFSNQFDLVSETPYSCDTVDREL